MNENPELRWEAEEERERFFSLSMDMLCIASTDGHSLPRTPSHVGRTMP